MTNFERLLWIVMLVQPVINYDISCSEYNFVIESNPCNLDCRPFIKVLDESCKIYWVKLLHDVLNSCILSFILIVALILIGLIFKCWNAFDQKPMDQQNCAKLQDSKRLLALTSNFYSEMMCNVWNVYLVFISLWIIVYAYNDIRKLVFVLFTFIGALLFVRNHIYLSD